MTDKITLYRLKEEMPEKKKCDWQGTNATISEVMGYNQALDDIASEFEKVEIGREELIEALVQAYCTDENKFKVVDPGLIQDMVQAILELLKGEK